MFKNGREKSFYGRCIVRLEEEGQPNEFEPNHAYCHNAYAVLPKPYYSWQISEEDVIPKTELCLQVKSLNIRITEHQKDQVCETKSI